MPTRRTLALIAILATVSAGCDKSDLHPAQIAAIALPDSISGQDPLSVAVYTFRGDCTVTTEPTTFSALNDSTYELRLRQTGGTPGVGCPGGIWADRFELPRPPARTFHVRFVGANTVEATVHGGTSPASGVREAFSLRAASALPTDSLTVFLVGCGRGNAGPAACRDTLGTLRAAGGGRARFEGPCALDGAGYQAEARFGGGVVLLDGRFRCGRPGQTILLPWSD